MLTPSPLGFSSPSSQLKNNEKVNLFPAKLRKKQRPIVVIFPYPILSLDKAEAAMPLAREAIEGTRKKKWPVI